MASGPISRVAMVSVHTSPLAQPGAGDAGGMNVYVLEVARHLARRGVAVEIFTRTTSGRQDPVVELEPGLLVRHVAAGPYEGLAKEDLPGQLCAFAAGVMRTAAQAPQGFYDLVHSHYWLSGQVGWLAADRWQVPLVHTMHTMARVKNRHLAHGERPEPRGREIGEEQVVEAADRLVANTEQERRDLVDLYAARSAAVSVVPPGVDLSVFVPTPRARARAEVGVRPDAVLLLFVGRIQPLKGPDVLIRAAAEIADRRPDLRRRLSVGILGGVSGSAGTDPVSLRRLASELGIADLVRFVPPVDRRALAAWYASADLVAVPSHTESFGLVAIEAGASGAPVVAADVGGLPDAVGDGGLLVHGHDPLVWADRLETLVDDPATRAELARRGIRHASGYGWDRTADLTLDVYEAALAGRRPSPIGQVGALAGVPAAVIP